MYLKKNLHSIICSFKSSGIAPQRKNKTKITPKSTTNQHLKVTDKKDLGIESNKEQCHPETKTQRGWGSLNTHQTNTSGRGQRQQRSSLYFINGKLGKNMWKHQVMGLWCWRNLVFSLVTQKLLHDCFGSRSYLNPLARFLEAEVPE